MTVTDKPLFGGKVSLRPAGASDSTRFQEILGHPDVRRWWGDAEEGVTEQVAYLLDADEDTTCFAVEFEDAVVGVILAFEEDDPQYRHAGIDIAVHPDFHGKGIGADAIHTLASFLLDQRGHHRLVIDPAAHNAAAIRVYQRLGFKTVGTMRRYERGPDGTWHDGLLLDLLAGDLVAP